MAGLSDIIDDFHQAVLIENQKIRFNLLCTNASTIYYKTLFKSKKELIDSIKILQQKCENDRIIIDKNIEQEMSFYKPTNSKNKLKCKTIHFNNGRQKHHTNTLVTFVDNIESIKSDDANTIPFEIQMLEITNCDDISVNDCIAMITDLKLNMIINNWVLSIVLSKTWFMTSDEVYHKLLSIPEKTDSKRLNIYKLKEIKAKMLNSEFTIDNFITTAPYEYADKIGIQIDFISNPTYFHPSHISKIVKLLENSLIDTCRIFPQDIYIKIATLLKIQNIQKYQYGKYGNKKFFILPYNAPTFSIIKHQFNWLRYKIAI